MNLCSLYRRITELPTYHVAYWDTRIGTLLVLLEAVYFSWLVCWENATSDNYEIEAVSYTHLDVYKRQEYYIKRLG